MGSLAGAGLALGLTGIGSAEAVAAPLAPVGPNPILLKRALGALQKYQGRVAQRDLIAIADFSRASATPRFHLFDTVNGRTTTLLVSHGKGSDPSHSGFVQRFSNQDGSEASSEGAYVTGETYVGKHGRSRKLIGLEPTNCNAYSRAIVIHGAWYVSPQLAQSKGKIGRSQGCFAVSESDLQQVLARLGPGRLLYAAKA